MVQVIKAYKFRLELVTKSVLTAIFMLCHACRSFHFNENAETLNSYVICIIQVAKLLGYNEPQVLEVFFKNTHPRR